MVRCKDLFLSKTKELLVLVVHHLVRFLIKRNLSEKIWFWDLQITSQALNQLSYKAIDIKVFENDLLQDFINHTADLGPVLVNTFFEADKKFSLCFSPRSTVGPRRASGSAKLLAQGWSSLLLSLRPCLFSEHLKALSSVCFLHLELLLVINLKLLMPSMPHLSLPILSDWLVALSCPFIHLELFAPNSSI